MSQNSSGGGYTATAHCEPDYNFAHNARVPGSVYDQEHIGVGEHEHWIGGNELSPEKLFNAVFKDAVEKFNENQKRSDRKIKSYYQRVLDDGRFGKKKTLKYGNKEKIVDISRKPIYEFILQIGNRMILNSQNHQKQKRFLNLLFLMFGTKNLAETSESFELIITTTNIQKIRMANTR